MGTKIKKPSTPRRRRITKRLVDAMRPGERYSDSELIGFVVRRQRREAPVFSLRYRAAGARALFRIGAHGQVTVEEARAVAKKKLAAIARGSDPAHERRVARDQAGRTVNYVLDEFLERYCYNQDRPLSSADQYRDAYRRHVRPYIGRLSIYRLMDNRELLAGMFDQIEDTAGATSADRVLAYSRRAFSWWEARDSHFRQPIVRGMARTKPLERARIRTLDDQEQRDLEAALDFAKVPACYPRYIRFLRHTAVRRSEAAAMRWEEVTGGTWTIPATRSKTKLPIEIPLTPTAQALLGPRQKSGVVFSNDGGVSAFSGFSKAKEALDTAINDLRKADGRPPMPPFVQHDLRRSARTLLSRAGIASDIAEKCLGHLPPAIRRVYDKHAYFEEKLHAFERLDALIERILNPVGDDVVAFPTRR
jgi:integrase